MPHEPHEPPQEQEDLPLFLFLISLTIINTAIAAMIDATIIVGTFISDPHFLLKLF